jgi:putative inorganic carbon (HCO3(-)) transporter
MIQQIAKQAADLEIWVLLAITATSLFWIELLPLVVLAGVLFWLIRYLGYRYLTLRTAADWGIVVLVLSLLGTVLITSVPDITIPQVWRVLTGIVLYYALVNWCRTHHRVHYLMVGAMAAGLLLALFAPLSVEWAFDKVTFIPVDLYQRFQLLVQDLVHPNVLAGSLVLLLPFPLSYLLFGWKNGNWSERLLAISAILLMTAMLVLTRSRGAWMAALVSVLLLLVLRDRRSLILIGLAGAGFLVLAVQFGFSRILEAAFYSRSLGDWNGRLEIWLRAVNLIRDFSISGIGMGSFQELAERFYAYDKYAPDNIPHTHNLFLQVTVDLGLPGIIAWTSILLVILLIAWKIFETGKHSHSSILAAAGAAILASQVSLVVHGLTDAVIWGMVRPAPLVWIIWGIAAAVWNYSQENVRRKRKHKSKHKRIGRNTQ